MDLIEKYYNDYNFPSVEKLYKLMKNDNISVTKKEVKSFLDKQEEAQIIRPAPKVKKQLGKVVSFKPNSIWNMDLFFLQKYHTNNKGYKYILCVIDVFTRKAYAQPLKTKEEDEFIAAFLNIIKTSGTEDTPYLIVSDSDSTFTTSKKIDKLMNKLKIALNPVPTNDHHALGIIDNFAKRIKQILHKHFIKTHTHNWVDILPKIIENYNKTPHTSILDIKPNDADSKTNIPLILELNRQKAKSETTFVNKFKAGDKVRIKIDDKFSKKSEGTFSKEIYEVESSSGRTVLLTNGKRKKYDMLLKIDPNTVTNNKPDLIKKAKKDYQVELLHKKIDILPQNILANNKRIITKNKNYI